MCDSAEARQRRPISVARALAVAALAVAMVALPACGGSSDSSDGASVLSRAEFIHEADQICDDAHKRAYEVTQKIQKLYAAKQAGEVSEQQYRNRAAALSDSYAMIANRSLREIRALGTPRGGTKDVDKYLSAVGGIAHNYYMQGYALLHQQEQKVSELGARTLRLTGQARKAAQEFGFHVCGGAGSSGGGK